MAIAELGVVLVGLLLVLATAVVLFIMLFVYTHFDKKLKQRFADLENREREFLGHISRVNDARLSDSREVKKRLETIEGKLDIVFQPEGEEKELEKEKVKVRARK